MPPPTTPASTGPCHRPSTGSSTISTLMSRTRSATPSTVSSVSIRFCHRWCRSATRNWNVTTSSLVCWPHSFVTWQNLGSTLGSQIGLTHLALEKTGEGSVALDPDAEGEVVTIFSGAGKIYAPDEALLSEIIAQMNERFGTRFTDAQAVHTRSRAKRRCPSRRKR